jgi:hypothetical protein
LINTGTITYAAILRHSSSGFAVLSASAVPGNPKSGNLRFEVIGASLAFYVDDVLRTSVFDGALTAGSAGMFSL